MTRITQLKLGLAVAAVLIWAYGYRADDSVARWVAIALLAASFLLRLVGRRSNPLD